jgi:hypothetical protein
MKIGSLYNPPAGYESTGFPTTTLDNRFNHLKLSARHGSAHLGTKVRRIVNFRLMWATESLSQKKKKKEKRNFFTFFTYKIAIY